MYNIKNDIKNSIYKNLYLLCGEENYLIDYYTNEIVKANTDSDTLDFNLMKIFKELPPEEEIDAFVNSYPFMSEKKVLVFQSTGILKKSTEAQRNYISSVISQVPEYIIIIFAESEIDKRNALYKQIAKDFPVCEFEYQSIADLGLWITRFLRSLGKEITRDNASYIADIAGPSMTSIKSELEKLASFSKDTDEISTDMIDALVTRNIENRVFLMVDDIVDKKTGPASEKLNDLKALNEEPIKIISIIFKKFATFHKLILLKNKPIKEICSLTGLYEKHAKNNLQKANMLGAKKIAQVMLRCRDMDFAIKNGSIDKWVAVETIISEILAA